MCLFCKNTLKTLLPMQTQAFNCSNLSVLASSLSWDLLPKPLLFLSLRRMPPPQELLQGESSPWKGYPGNQGQLGI